MGIMTSELPKSILAELDEAAADVGDAAFLVLDDVDVSYRDVRAVVERFATNLLDAGIVAGDRVLVFLPNGLAAVCGWLGTQRIGAIDVPVAVESAGASLAHVVSEVAPRAVLTTDDLLERLLAAAPAESVELIIVDGSIEDSADRRIVRFEDMISLEGDPQLPEIPDLSTTATVMFSSGSTGPPKGVMHAHGYYAQTTRAYDEIYQLPDRPTFYCAQPLCHIDPRIIVLDTLRRRGKLVLKRRFSASGYWADVEHHDADVFIFIGAMLHLIFKQTPSAAPSRRRLGLGSAIPADIHAAFSERFEVELIEGYGMTELYSMTCQRPGERRPGNVGSELPTVELRVVDGDDQPVPDGTTGQLIARPRLPFAHMQGYWGRPEATVEAWQGLWFHTGDLMRRLEDGTFQYVGRLKDSIRRRGENVSAWEVERAALKHPDVLEAAAIGVPAAVGDEDVALFVVPRADTTIDPGELRDLMAEDLPRYALPRFVELTTDLPKTPSERVAKAVLRERGLSDRVSDLAPERR